MWAWPRAINHDPSAERKTYVRAAAAVEAAAQLSRTPAAQQLSGYSDVFLCSSSLSPFPTVVCSVCTALQLPARLSRVLHIQYTYSSALISKAGAEFLSLCFFYVHMMSVEVRILDYSCYSGLRVIQNFQNDKKLPSSRYFLLPS